VRRLLLAPLFALFSVLCFLGEGQALLQPVFFEGDAASGLRGTERGGSRGLAASDLIGVLGNPMVFKMSYAEKDSGIELFDEGVQRKSLKLVTASSMPGMLSSEAELSYTSFDSQIERQNDSRNRLLRFALKGSAAGMRYGAEYRSVGATFAPPPGSQLKLDQEGTEVWSERRLGPLGLKTVFSEFWNNVEQDRRRPRVTTTQGGPVLDLTIPSGPVFSLSYLQGSSKQVWATADSTPHENWLENYGISVFYRRSSWDATISSHYSPTKDKASPEKGLTISHQISGSYRPTSFLTLAPSLSVTEEKYSWSGARAETPAISISLTYNSLFNVVDLTSSSFYTRTRSSDGFTDMTTINVTQSAVWNLGKVRGNKTLSFNVVYNEYVDALTQAASYKEVLARLILKVVGW
jgi:hypothetical protein